MDLHLGSTVNVDKLSKLPDEVVEMILNYLNDSRDIASISRASPVCARILLPSKPAWLFHQILPHVAPYLPKSSVLNCRKVCSKWQQAVSHHLENCSNSKTLETFAFAPTTTMAMTGFGYAMKNHPRNPFPAGCVDFRKVNGGRLSAGYWIHVFQFLSSFGEHIYTCSFDFNNARFDLFVIILRQCLAHLKNVKRLTINWKFDNSLVGEEKMVQDLEAPRFPRLEKLEHLELTGVYSRLFYEKVIVAMYSAQLKTLKADGIF